MPDRPTIATAGLPKQGQPSVYDRMRKSKDMKFKRSVLDATGMCSD